MKLGVPYCWTTALEIGHRPRYERNVSSSAHLLLQLAVACERDGHEVCASAPALAPGLRHHGGAQHAGAIRAKEVAAVAGGLGGEALLEDLPQKLSGCGLSLCNGEF